MFVNKVIKVLILSDLALLVGLGFLAPILAIFLTENIQGGDVSVAGFAAMSYWVTNALAIIPLGRYLDKHKGEKDDLIFIMIGNFLAALAIICLIFAKLPWHVYLLEVVYGIGMGMNIPGYTAIFTRHIDKGKEAYSWSLRTAMVSAGTGVAGALGGIIVKMWGFDVLLSIIFVFIIISTILPFMIMREMSSGKKEVLENVTEIKTMSGFPPKE